VRPLKSFAGFFFICLLTALGCGEQNVTGVGANGVADEKVRLVPHSETFFMATNGLSYDFDPEGNPAAFMVERHVSGDWRYARQPER
jgi:hypothetical protein